MNEYWLIWTCAITSELLANYPLLCLEGVTKRKTKHLLRLSFLAFQKAQLTKLVLHASIQFKKSKYFLVLAVKFDLQEPFKQVLSLNLFPHFDLELWAFKLLILSGRSCMRASNCSNCSDIFRTKNSLQVVGMFPGSSTSFLQEMAVEEHRNRISSLLSWKHLMMWWGFLWSSGCVHSCPVFSKSNQNLGVLPLDQ